MSCRIKDIISFFFLFSITFFVMTSGSFANPATEACAHKFQQLEDELYYGSKCETDADCMSVYIGCPFGCGTALNKSFDVAVFNVKKKLYENSCGACAYMCVKEPKELICGKGKCRLIYHSEIEGWREEERQKRERERRERIELKYYDPGEVEENVETIE